MSAFFSISRHVGNRFPGIRGIGGFLFVSLIIFLFSGCVSSFNKRPAGVTVYLNSFEAPTDTLSWYWAGSYQLIDDTPPGGGKKALRIRGGNLLPAASFLTQPLRQGGYFVMECWGKTLDVGGYVELATISNHEILNTISLAVIEPQWKLIQSSDTLYCPPSSSLMLTMHASSLKEGTILIDMIHIKKVAAPDQFTAPITNAENSITERR